MRKRATRPTLADVAKHARVSTATASRVIHNTGPVSHELRKRIQGAVASIGYAPRSTTIPVSEATLAVLAGNLANPYFPEVIAGIQEEAASYGIGLILFNLTDSPQNQQQILHRLEKRALNGVIVMGGQPFPELFTWRDQAKIPLVLINHFVDKPDVYSIGIDMENAMCRATQYLISLNHTRIGHIAGPSSWGEISQSRRRGIERAMAEAGLTFRPEWCSVVSPGSQADGGFHAMNNLLGLPSAERPTAVIAFNDMVAFGALHAIHASGLRVPQDISLIGVDDIFVAAHSKPPLTTIDQPKYRIGKLAVEIAHQASQGREDLRNCTLLESPLIIRESAAPYNPNAN
ncbi:MAG: LacI family DNA-binding transcriptional regulator [Chloroflexi bacterium]|nr:LacI family DNA-binding transcriptional regulator [Chloroflexota bacterium]